MMQVGTGWPFYLAHSKNNALHLFVFDFEESEKAPSVDSLIAHKSYRRITVGKAELKRTNWRVVIE